MAERQPPANRAEGTAPRGWRGKLRLGRRRLEALRRAPGYVRHAEVAGVIAALRTPERGDSLWLWIVRRILFTERRMGRLAAALEGERKKRNERVIRRLSSDPGIAPLQGLNAQQKRAAVRSDDRNRILAGAGTGKTHTMVAKARMLVECEGIEPGWIAFVTFTNRAAEEIRGRIEATMGAAAAGAMAIGTIHSLARRVRALAGLPDRAVDPLAEESGTADRYRRMTEWIGRCLEDEPALRIEVWRRNGALERVRLPHDEVACRYVFRARGKDGIRVKSMGEWEICRILTQYRIPFRYEDPFPVPEGMRDGSGRPYRPDFRIMTADGGDIWLEHWGLDRRGEVPGHWKRSTGQYREQMAWKRRVHKAAGTVLVETTYGEMQEAWLGSADRTFEQVVIGRIASRAGKSDREMEERRLSDSDMAALLSAPGGGTYVRLAHEVDRWIQAFRQSTFDTGSALEAARRSEDPIESTALAALSVRVMAHYHRALEAKGTTDHNETVQEARTALEEGRAQVPWRAVIVDEYQDVNRAQDAFLRVLAENAAGPHPAQLFVVGDDWQAIYGFQGGAVGILRSFGEGLPGTTTTVLPQTHRFREPLARTTRRFVLRDRLNRDKSVRGRAGPPLVGGMPEAVQVVGADLTDRGREEWGGSGRTAPLEMIIDHVGREWKGEGRRPSVMVLARKRRTVGNRRMGIEEKRKEVAERLRRSPLIFAAGDGEDLGRRIDRMAEREIALGVDHPALRARAMEAGVRLDLETVTVHGAKGSEADVVVLVDGDPRSVGERREERALEVALRPLRPEGFSLEAEERRIWYVALTRAREKVYVVSPPKDEHRSPMLDELVAGSRGHYDVGEREFAAWCAPYEPPVPCPRCREIGNPHGRLVRRTGKYGRFTGCTSYTGDDGYESCGHTEDLCDACGEGIMRRMPRNRARCNGPRCGHEAPLCGCSPGLPMKERVARNRGLPFWGCQRHGRKGGSGCGAMRKCADGERRRWLDRQS